MDQNKATILNFVSKYRLCVLATCENNIPESALVDFIMTADLEIIFNTYTTSKKYKNLKKNPIISVVIGFGDELKTLQYYGVVKELEGHQIEEVIEKYGQKTGFSRPWKIRDMRYFKVKPTWINLSDFSQYPPKEIELNFKY